MEFAKIVTFMFPLLIVLPEVSTYKPDNILIQKKIAKRHADNSRSRRKLEFQDFVENKLVEHSQAFEHLLKLVNEVLNIINAVAENIDNKWEEQKLPGKNARNRAIEERTGDTDEKSKDASVSFGKNLEKYSAFYKDIFMKSLKNQAEPIPVVARKY